MRGGWLGGDVHGAVLREELLSLIDVRFGSLADIPRCPGHVRYYPESRHCPRVYEYTP
jgi:hypothetical protein